MTVPLEKMFEFTQLHTRMYQVLPQFTKTMELNRAIQMAYANRTVRNRRLAYGEIVKPYEYTRGFASKILLSQIDFPGLILI
jgi:hypothetical protein